MKDIIVVENKAFLNKTDFVCIEDIVKDLKVEYKIEKCPTSWEELKELCKGKKNIEVDEDAIFVKDAEVILLRLYDDGIIKDSGREEIANDRTPQQMWQIIKNLIGEE